MHPLIESLKGKLIVSCQALPGTALRDSETLARMALGAMRGGAAAIRADGVADITAIKKLVNLPIIGLNKEKRDMAVPFITPTFEHAKAIAELGAEIIALDATLRPHPNGVTAAELIRRVKSELGVLVMADIATFEDGIAAAEAGADLLSTTLAGYTLETMPMPPGPDLELLRRLVKAVDTPVVAEGRYCTPGDVAVALSSGAHAVVIGKMITNPEFITRYFIEHFSQMIPSHTEDVNPATRDFDRKSTYEMAALINEQDATVATAVRCALPEIARAVDEITPRLANGGRLFYIGVGTSGRIAVQDAAECPPTYGVPADMIQAIIAGGRDAVFHPVENAEDDAAAGNQEIERHGIGEKDVVIGISANGNAPFVCGAITEANARKALTVAIVCNDGTRLAELADHAVILRTGAEVICGSTRMKAGTSQKMALNMISTMTMVKLGHVTGNFMTSMKPVNQKLLARAVFIVSQVCGVDEKSAKELLEAADWNIRQAIVDYRNNNK